MKNNKKFKTIIIVLTVILIFTGIICGIFFFRSKDKKTKNEETPEKTLDSFINVLNHEDISGILDYLEPSEAEILKSEFEKNNEITDSEIIGKLKDYLPFLSELMQSEVLPEFDIKIKNTNIDDKNSVISVDINDTELNYNIYLIKINNKWYIQYALKSDNTTETETTTSETTSTLSATTITTTISNTSALVSGTVSTTRTVTVTTVKEDVTDGEFVRILDYIPDAVIDLRYATTNNFTGTVIYDDSEAYLCYGTVKKLAKVQEALKEKGFSIIVWDAYRSEEAQYRLWEVCPDPTYVADPRNGTTSHSRGNTIDLGIVYTDESEVELPSGFDEFSLIADRDYSDVSAEAGENSRLLENIMNEYGFNGYWGEWWHYSDKDVYDISY